MALQAYCSTCRRTVYIDEGDTPVCPVCSMPLLETQETSNETSDQTDGAK
ncbi:MAG: hypothetical protein ACLGHL_01105 [Actinomycetota bacterium]